MKFLANMCISTRAAKWLRAQGHDVVHLDEEGLQRLRDAEILSKARSEERTLLTMDLDFGYLLAVSGERLPSVILFRLNNESTEVVNERLADILDRCQDDLVMGVIVAVTEQAIRVRRLPITQ